MALVPTLLKETANSYNVKFYNGFNTLIAPHNGKLITLDQAPGHEDKALPHPTFLDTHYRPCEIWHTSGGAEELRDQI
ncbi:hypothetical protein N7486_002180 [Penicillium sp. IBT 16267x]|nr:hypothetical protein N7486_002180 [Penicillium sp. IBT 16267x]